MRTLVKKMIISIKNTLLIYKYKNYTRFFLKSYKLFEIW